MEKWKAYYFYKLNRAKIPINTKTRQEMETTIKHYGLDCCKNAYKKINERETDFYTKLETLLKSYE